MNHSLAKLCQRAEVGQLFKHDLPGAEVGCGLRSVIVQHCAHLVAEVTQGGVPIDLLAMQQWHSGTIWCIQHAERLPTLGAGSAHVDRIIRIRREVDRRATLLG